MLTQDQITLIELARPYKKRGMRYNENMKKTLDQLQNLGRVRIDEHQQKYYLQGE